MDAKVERQSDAVETLWHDRLADAQPEQVLLWAVETFGDRLTVACSFGGITGLALLDLVRECCPKVDIFTVDTGYLFPETVALRQRLRKNTALALRVLEPVLTPEEQASQYGDRLWETDPDRCCAIRKVEPATRALAGRDAWVVGLRRDQSDTRTEVTAVAWDSVNRLYRVAPFCRWTEDQVLDWMLERNVEVHPLYFAGYRSIGCTHCTRPVADGADLRSGRWAGTGKRECGLHLRPVGEDI